MLFGTLGASFLGNMLAGKGIVKTTYGSKGKEIVRAGYGSNGFLIPHHPMTKIEIKRHYQNNSRINGAYSRDNLPSKIKDGTYKINLDEYADAGTHWITLYVLNNDVIYLDSFGVDNIPREIRCFIGNKNIQTNIFRIQPYDSVMCGYSCIGFMNYILAGKT